MGTNQTTPRYIETAKGKGVHTTLADMEAIQALRGIQKPFAQELYRKSHLAASGHDLTHDQLVWAHILAMEVKNPAPRITEDIGNVEPLMRLFEVARQNLSWPKIRLRLGLRDVVLHLVPTGKNAGTVNVTDGGSYGDRTWFGRIRPDGTFTPSKDAPAGLLELLVRMAMEPAKTAMEFGLLTGRCCFCGAALSDERSTAAGFGPTCADNYGLTEAWKAASGVLRSNLPEAQ